MRARLGHRVSSARRWAYCLGVGGIVLLSGCARREPELSEDLLGRLIAEAHLLEVRYPNPRMRDSAFAAICRSYGVDTSRFYAAYRNAVSDPERLRALMEEALRWLEGTDTTGVP
nr:MAG: hypothetical protein KatS3mg041_0525 [Bacteroidota bacterium]